MFALGIQMIAYHFKFHYPVANIFENTTSSITLPLFTHESLPSRMYHGKFIAKEDYPALIATSDM